MGRIKRHTRRVAEEKMVFLVVLCVSLTTFGAKITYDYRQELKRSHPYESQDFSPPTSVQLQEVSIYGSTPKN